jgi:hypothetical protein
MTEINDRSDYFLETGKTWIFPQCNECKHFALSGKIRCTAFPDGIPNEILDNIHDHKTPYPGDNGIRFEERGIA